MEFIGPQIWIGTEAASHVFQDLYDIGFKRCTEGKSYFFPDLKKLLPITGFELRTKRVVGSNQVRAIFFSCPKNWHFFSLCIVALNAEDRLSWYESLEEARLMGHFWALFERKCENEGRKTQSQARIMACFSAAWSLERRRIWSAS